MPPQRPRSVTGESVRKKGTNLGDQVGDTDMAMVLNTAFEGPGSMGTISKVRGSWPTHPPSYLKHHLVQVASGMH